MAKAASLQFLCVLGLAGCVGNVNDKSPGGGGSSNNNGGKGTGGGDDLPGSGDDPAFEPAPGVSEAAPARIRRLNNVEIKNSLRDIFGVEVKQAFTSDLQRHDFDNQFESLGFTPDFAAALQGAAEEVSAAIGPKFSTLVDCNPTGAEENKCAETFITRVGLRLYRRPLTSAERTNLMDLYTAVKTGRTFEIAIATVAEAMIQSPQFAYRTEMGVPDGGKLASLSPFEIASWLSYGLWRSTPDETLLAAASDGKLSKRTDVQSQATRLLEDDRAKAAFRDFTLQWLDMAEPEALRKTDPGFKESTTASMVGETAKFFEDIAWVQEGSLEKLLTENVGYPNAELASLYGVQMGGNGGFNKVTLPESQRAGFLTQPGFIAAHMPGGETSPISIGRFVRVGLLCQPLPPPPAGVPEISQEPSLTTRQRFAQHSTDVRCSGCHALIDPIGFGFEKYDVMGRYRETEAGMALTGKGELHDTDIDGPFTGAVELAERLSTSDAVQACFAAHMLKFMLGRDTTNPDVRLSIDEATLTSAVKEARMSGSLKVRDLVVALATSDAGLMRNGSNVLAD